MILEHLKEQARRAHDGTSFSPERRGDQMIKDYSAELQEDIAHIRAIAAKYGEDPDSTITRYTERYTRHFSAWLSSKGNCISSMIVGPSKFPVRRAEKANNIEHSKHEFFRVWRVKCLRAIERGFKPRITPITELEKARKDLAACEALQELMKRANDVIRKAKGDNCQEQLYAMGFKERKVAELLNPWRGNRKGFQQWELANNNANIRRLRVRVQELEVKAERSNAGEKKELEVNGVRFVENYEEDRLQIFFGRDLYLSLKEKLSKDLRAWHFSKANGCCWQRKLTQEAMHSARCIIKTIQNINNEPDQRTSETH